MSNIKNIIAKKIFLKNYPKWYTFKTLLWWILYKTDFTGLDRQLPVDPEKNKKLSMSQIYLATPYRKQFVYILYDFRVFLKRYGASPV